MSCKYGKLKHKIGNRRCKLKRRKSTDRRGSRRSHRGSYGLSALLMLAAIGGTGYLVVQNAKASATPPA